MFRVRAKKEEYMNTITWLHISDLHFQKEQIYNSNIVINSLLDDIKERIEDDSLQPNFIIISGDISSSSLPEEYSLCCQFLDRLRDITSVEKENIIIVPGNHDVDRNAYPLLLSGLRSELTSVDSVNRFISTELTSILPRFNNFYMFMEHYFENYNYSDTTRLFFTRRLKDCNLSIIGLNSAWMSIEREEQGKLLLGERQVRDALEKTEEPEIIIAILHHPFEWINGFDRLKIEALLFKECNFILHGHMHQPGFSLNITPDSEAIIIAAGACYETREYPNSYNFVKIDLDTNRGVLYLRKYSDERDGFWTKDVTSYRNIKDGIYNFDLPQSMHSLQPRSKKKTIKLNGEGRSATVASYFGNSYLLKENFSGRISERKMLTKWMSEDMRHIFALTAMGGMGKSSLAWIWLHKDVLDKSLPGMLADSSEDVSACQLPQDTIPSAVFWWSFYDQQANFENFINWLLNITKNNDIKDILSLSKYDRVARCIQILRDNYFLLILDGFERELRAYSTLNSAYKEMTIDEDSSDFNKCIDINASAFLRLLASESIKSKVLLTSRILPHELSESANCIREKLYGLEPNDAVRFFYSQRISGARSEIESVCKLYEHYPLALHILSGMIFYDPFYPMDIRAARGLSPIPKLKQREHHVLEIAYSQLSSEKKALLSRMAASRSSLDFSIISVLNPFKDVDNLKDALIELEKRSLISFDRVKNRYDLHQVVREYTYDKLENKNDIHSILKKYFEAIVKSYTNNNLIQIIELYHHTVNCGLYDEAFDIFQKRLSKYLYESLGEYQLIIKLLRALFPDGEDLPPRLSRKDNQGNVLNTLALCYDRTGQPKSAESAFEIASTLAEYDQSKSTVHNNLALTQMKLGKLEKAKINAKRNIESELAKRNKLEQAIGHLYLSKLEAYMGNSALASKELSIAERLNTESIKEKLEPSTIHIYRSFIYLLAGKANLALRSARKGYSLAKINRFESNMIEAELYLGKSIIASVSGQGPPKKELLNEAEHHLYRALTSCRRISLIELEPEILLSLAQYYRTTGNIEQAKSSAEEALYIANRCEYFLIQAEINNYLAMLSEISGDIRAAKKHGISALKLACCDGSTNYYKVAFDCAWSLLKSIGIKLPKDFNALNNSFTMLQLINDDVERIKVEEY